MVHKPRIYLGGPVAGLTWDEAIGWRRKFAAKLRRHGFEPLLPCEEERAARNMGPLPAADNTAPGCSNEEVFYRDLHMLGASSAVIANLREAQRPSLGTMWEIGYAFAAGIPVIVTVQPSSCHWHAFIEQSCTIVPTLDMALRTLKVLQKEGRI